MAKLSSPCSQRATRRATLITSLALSASLILSGCGGAEGTGDVDALDVVDFEQSDPQQAPDVTVDGAIEADEVSTRVLEQGEGETLDDEDLALIHTAVVDPTNSEVTQESFTGNGEALYIDPRLAEEDPTLHEALTTNPIGSLMAYYVPANTYGNGTPDQLLVFRISEELPTHADGEPVDESELDPALPTVTENEENGEPTIETPEGDPPEDLEVEVLKEGEGEQVDSNSFVTVQYRGIKWSDGEEFDSSWANRSPAQFDINGLIEGWKEGLDGQQVGSRVLISVPPEQGYGDSEGHELQEETLVFVVDILHKVDMTPPEGADQPAPSDEASE
ncbi:FKBP-type peptidyl-prolyl cis-trans isomerase [Auritidibacter ignavus]|uniref:FKBP-type peptidyl-prolyl cis-trans isomerase n=1 Tax=Auritidibacter ignavus TaxID=678932 RepID=UPI000F0339B8|nr:FKBP-type peptidyl-prolyl cis-trans isomerase [Auritidibacter ignavus]NIH70629.1 peptidylprolyl isomerase [Auritidibacter ignavus]RMX23237.1 peptidylprolyl isomerase [Auritidibacter ignavus]WGH86741.1 FKBP-type peptidyl-prolyl cis-trans isomerase [Auritidibacter ignavus]WGH89027.1 FKBP-type peptidyl-prolyl cis-trans isomerase [Auritidibacter ignavus]WHS34822.1 FKBP-type peptidyl-prolyl cis-trans isomerase [Auritidibacter ignavus]